MNTQITAELAVQTGRKLTDIHSRPSKQGMVKWCKLDGFEMTLADARKRMELQARMTGKRS